MPISPNQTAKAIRNQMVETICGRIDAILTDPYEISKVAEIGDKIANITISVPNNVGEDKIHEHECLVVCSLYKRAGWKDVEYLGKQLNPGKEQTVSFRLTTLREMLV